MKIKGINFEDFVNYKKPSMFIAFPNCSFKCDKECGRAVCQNSALAKEKTIEISIHSVVERYRNNRITQAVVLGGLEPFDDWEQVQNFVNLFRFWSEDDIVIYTGYKEEELTEKINWLKRYKNIIIKFGRFIPDQENHFDEVLGIKLSSPNQYARKL